MTTDGAPLPAQLRRLAHLAAGLPPDRCAVVLDDPRAEVASLAARSTTSTVHCVGALDIPAVIERLVRTGTRMRVRPVVAPPGAPVDGWREPIGLLCLAGERRDLRAQLSRWAPLVAAHGYVLFLSVPETSASSLGLRPDLWAAFPSADRPLLAQRLPYG